MIAMIQRTPLAISLLCLLFGSYPSQAEAGPKNQELVEKFPQTLSKIASEQKQLSQQWKQAQTKAEKTRLRQLAREFVVKNIIDEVFPAWMGTPWHMGKDDDATIPHQAGKRISCSMFVTAALQNAGLQLDSRRRWANSAALYIQRSLAPKGVDMHRYLSISPKQLALRLRKLKSGLYLIGLNCHVGFVLIKDQQVRFIHSNYVVPEEGVIDEPLAQSDAIAYSQKVGYWVTPIFQDDRLIEFWLEGKKVPIQRL